MWEERFGSHGKHNILRSVKLLNEKVAIITGASRGLGRALALRFSSEGAGVVICSRSQKAIHSVEQQIRGEGAECIALATDISKPSEVEDLLGVTFNRFERIDVLVNNASVLGPREPLLDYPYRDWIDVLEVNLTGTFLITKAVLRGMVEQRSGSIINVSSGVGSVGKPRWGAYLVSKFGIEGFTFMLAEEVKESNVRVNAVDPGPMRTPMRRAAYPEEDPKKLKTPEDISDVFVYLASDRSKGVTGQRLKAQEFTMPR